MQTDKISSVNMQAGMNIFRRKYSTHTPKMQPFKEGYFMQESPFSKNYQEKVAGGSIAKIFNTIKNCALKLFNK